MLAVASDQLAEQLDAAHGSEVVDHGIFRAHAAKYEVRTWQGCREGALLMVGTAVTVLIGEKGSSSSSSSEVVDHSIFKAHPAKYAVLR